MRLPTGILVLLLAAGCLQAPDPQTPFDEAKAAVDLAATRVLALDHDADGGHHRGLLHQGSHNMELVGYSNGYDASGDANRIPPRGVFNEIAIHGDLVYLSRTSSDGSFGGFAVIDVSDPANPKVVGEYKAQGGSDVEVTADGGHVFLATQRNTVEQVVGAAGPSQEPTAGLPRGIYVVDVADPTQPVLDSFHPLPANGPHTLTYFEHPNGSEYLLVSTYDLVTDPVTGAIAGSAPATQRMVAYLVTRNPAPLAGLPRIGLAPVAQYQLSAPPGVMAFPHDTSVQVHPLTGQVILTVAYWDLGVRLLDFSRPPAPGLGTGLPTLPELGEFTDFSPSSYDAIHYARPFPELLDAEGGEIQVTVAEPEIISADHETGQLTFLDTSDPARPVRVSHWTLPPQDPALGVTGLDFSPHNFDLVDGKVVLTHYHAGVWVIDLSTPANVADPKEVGFYMTAKPRVDSPAPQPYAWSVRARDGLLYVSDEATGLYVLRYTGP